MRKTLIFTALLVLIALAFIPSVQIPGKQLQSCEFISLIVALASMIAQQGLQAAGNQRAGIERKRYQNQLQGRIDDLNSWFNGENNKDFLQTDVAQSAVSGLLGQQDRQINALNNASVAGGATQEANIAAKGKLNENFSDAIARLLGYGTQYKQGLRDQYDYRLQSLYAPMDQLSQQKIGDWANYNQNVSNAGNAVSTAAGMIDWEDLLKKRQQGMGFSGYGGAGDTGGAYISGNPSWGQGVGVY
jgi:hypothetical protein